MKKIKVVSKVPYNVGLIIPEHRFARTFTREEQTILVDDEILREGMYNKGVENAFRNGILYIDDKDFRIEMGLEVPGEEKPEVNVLNSSQMLTLLKVKTAEEFQNALSTLSLDQIERLVSLAVEHKITDYEKCKLLKKYSGKDVMKIIGLYEEE
jgi:hypothetical protein